jgi:hypothetical protein
MNANVSMTYGKAFIDAARDSVISLFDVIYKSFFPFRINEPMSYTTHGI